MKWVSRFIYILRLVMPWVFRFFLFSASWTLKAMVAQFRGMPGAVNQISQDWTMNALVYGKIPLEYEKYIRWGMKAIAWVMIIFGYIIACHVVVLIVWWIL